MNRDLLKKVLERHGMTECPECLSWIYDTDAAKRFHLRRCGG